MNPAVTTVVDAGARYGMHTTWQSFEADLSYIMFEPDDQEAHRLTQHDARGCQVIAKALGKRTGTAELFLTKHRGYCSLTRPLDDSPWFKHRPGEGRIESVVNVEVIPLDDFVTANRLRVDFLKIDTEGTELDVLQGAEVTLRDVLGIRISVYFQPCYQRQTLFPELHTWLLDKGFYLLNLDYCGRGVPSNVLFRNPDPQSQSLERSGVLVATDAVYLRQMDPAHLPAHQTQVESACAALKSAYFCLLNGAVDVGIQQLLDFVNGHHGGMPAEGTSTTLYQSLRRLCATVLGRYRLYPDHQWEAAQGMFRLIFEHDLPSGSQYWEFLQQL